MKIMRLTWIIFCLTICYTASYGQVFTNKEVGIKKTDHIDSLKASEYPYSLPILGKKATKAGYSLPYSAGLSVQYLWQKQDLLIENLSVGFNNGPLYDLDEVIRFNNSVSEANGINIRPDIWLLPFLNVYGICAISKPSTTVGFGVWVPDSANVWNEVFSTSTKAEFSAVSLGFGMTPTIGVGGGFLALDMNFTWTDVDALDKPAFSFIFDPRLGKAFTFRNPERGLALWVGGFRWSINSNTNGSINLSDVISTDGLDGKIEDSFDKVTEAQEQVDIWWSNLNALEQSNPLNRAKYDAANKALETAGIFLNAADAAVNNLENSTVQYSLDKRPAMKWNFMIGGQFQWNKHWMLRAEYGFLGSRQHFFTGLQYRFGL
jgi:hypothetical protein